MKVRSVAGTDLAVTVSANGQSLTERLQVFENSKTMDLVTARYEVRLQGQLASMVLNGRVSLRTDSPLVGWMGAVPDGGRASITSQGTSSAWLALTANPTSVAATVQVDSNGNGVGDSSFELPWNDVLDGYLFWAQGAVPPKLMGVDVYPEAKPQRPDFALLANLTATGPLPLRPTFVWQMSLPIDLAALPTMVLRRQPPDTSPWIRVPDADWGPADVPVEVVAAEGSRLTLAPTVQLQPGRSYVFFQVVNGQAAEPNPVLRDVLGRSVTVFQDGQTRSGLKAAITMPPGPPTGPMGALGLDGSKSTDDMAAITQYAWRQTSGPAVRIESPDAATTLLSMVNGWPTAETTVDVELTITNAAGEIDVARFAMPVLPVPTTPPALYFRSAPDSYVGSGHTKALDGSSRFEAWAYGNYMFDVYVNEPSGTLWSLRFSTLYGDNRLTPGRYQGNGDVFANTLNFFGGGAGTSWESWTLDLRAIEWDTSGRVSVLDADFYLHSSDSRLYGSVRIGSGTPIRP